MSDAMVGRGRRYWLPVELHTGSVMSNCCCSSGSWTQCKKDHSFRTTCVRSALWVSFRSFQVDKNLQMQILLPAKMHTHKKMHKSVVLWVWKKPRSQQLTEIESRMQKPLSFGGLCACAVKHLLRLGHCSQPAKVSGLDPFGSPACVCSGQKAFTFVYRRRPGVLAGMCLCIHTAEPLSRLFVFPSQITPWLAQTCLPCRALTPLECCPWGRCLPGSSTTLAPQPSALSCKYLPDLG